MRCWIYYLCSDLISYWSSDLVDAVEATHLVHQSFHEMCVRCDLSNVNLDVERINNPLELVEIITVLILRDRSSKQTLQVVVLDQVDQTSVLKPYGKRSEAGIRYCIKISSAEVLVQSR